MPETNAVGHVRKMRVEDGDPILYTLALGDFKAQFLPGRGSWR